MANKAISLTHTKWLCKYRIVFTPKYRRKIIYTQYRASLPDIIKWLCSYKGVEIIEGHMMSDHVHLLLSIPLKMSVSSIMGYLKGKTLWWFLINKPIQSINLGIAILGQKDTMLVQQGSTKRPSKNICMSNKSMI